MMCINDTNNLCKPKEDIEDLIKLFIITQYYLRETLNLYDIKDISKRPVRSELTYEDQF